MYVLERMEARNEYEKYWNKHAILEPEYLNPEKDLVGRIICRIELSPSRCFISHSEQK
jgi:hypothetical protein